VTSPGPVAVVSPVPVGTVLAGKYVVERVLGVGGMGVVVAAKHRVLDQWVALKFLHGEALADASIVERFIREARSVVKLESQFVARVSDVGVLESGSPFIVMELLEGEDLAQRIEAYATRGPLPVADAVDRILEAIDALAEAHSHDIVHRDLKPANLFLATRADGSVATKVLDFGISKVLSADEATSRRLTHTSALLGTPMYMAPEQVRGSKAIDARVDVWSMGVVLYEVLTGRLPFDGEAIGSIFAALLESEPVPLRTLRPELDPGLERVVLRCLEKDPRKRYPDVAVLAEALAPFGSGKALASVARARAVLARRNRGSAPELPPEPVAPRHPTGPGVSRSFTKSGGVAPPTSSPTRLALGPLLAIGALALAAVGLGAFALSTRSTAGISPAASSQAAGERAPAPPAPTSAANEADAAAAVAPQVGVPASEDAPSASARPSPSSHPASKVPRRGSQPAKSSPASPVIPDDRQ
jgi:serine/threonine-protein kinase